MGYPLFYLGLVVFISYLLPASVLWKICAMCQTATSLVRSCSSESCLHFHFRLKLSSLLAFYCHLLRWFVCSRNAGKMSDKNNTHRRPNTLYLLIRSQAQESVWGYQLASGLKHISAALGHSKLSGYPLFCGSVACGCVFI